MAKGGGTTRRKNTGIPMFSDNTRQVIDSVSLPYDELIRSDYELAMIFDDYTSGSSEINSVARFGRLLERSYNSNNVSEWKDYIKELDKAIDKMPRLSRHLDMFRTSTTLGSLRLNGKSITEIKKHIGETFTDKGYTSFSMRREAAKRVNTDSDYVIVYKAKPGLKGVSLANTSAFNSMERQEEFLTGRNTKFTKIGAREIKGQKYLFVK